MRQQLSKRQHECLQFASEGYNATEIGKLLGISPRSVEVHRAFAKKKLGAATISHAMMIFNYSHGWPQYGEDIAGIVTEEQWRALQVAMAARHGLEL